MPARHLRPLLGLLVGCLVGGGASAQAPRSVSRADARASALRLAPRLRLALGDTALAAATLRDSRLLPDPTLSYAWSKSAPTRHLTLEVPLDLPWVRSQRIAAAEAGRTGSAWRLAFERAATALDADTAYTRALAARERRDASRRDAIGADSLRRIAMIRRDAGDASELDVQVAAIGAGQQRNRAAADSAAYDDALLALQTTMGLAGDTLVIVLTDTLAPPPDDAPRWDGTPVLVAAAQADLAAATATAFFARRNRIGMPMLTAGIESGDDASPGALPTVGLSVPLPLFNRNQGAAAIATAEMQRAEATLAAVRLESAAARSRARRAFRLALDQIARDADLLAAADRVTAMSITAYREGAATLASVLEAQRGAREVRLQYLDDVAAAWIARGVVLLLAESTPDRP